VVSGTASRAWRAVGAFAAAAAGCGLASAAYQEYGAARDRGGYPPPGRLVDVGGRKLHLLAAAGTGPPVVVIPAVGGPALEWVSLQRALSPDVPVILYDRAGLGWSDPAPGPRSAGAMASELHALLGAAGIAPPYVLAGHSIGGLAALAYTARYRSQVAALALIEPSHPDMDERLPRYGMLPSRADWTLRAARLRARPLGRRRLASDLGVSQKLSEEARRSFPPDLAAAGRALMLSPGHRRAAAAEMFAIDRTCDEARAAMTGLSGLPGLPLTVLTRTEPCPGEAQASCTGLRRSRWLATWRELHEEFAALVPGAAHVFAPGAGHYVHRDDPGLVARVLRDLARQSLRGC
jgi:pimeloyl-ACP methyl ester carboxylesterase